jgi:hypothetical protein
MATVPRCPDCEPRPVKERHVPTRLERLARELDAEPWEVRLWLYAEIERRRPVTTRAAAGGTPPA